MKQRERTKAQPKPSLLTYGHRQLARVQDVHLQPIAAALRRGIMAA